MTQSTGVKNFFASAYDNAGNKTKIERTYTVVAAPAPASVRVTSPNGGQVWARGTSHAITWTHQNLASGARLKVEVLKGLAVVATPGSNVNPYVGSVNWSISNALTAGNNYKVRITVISTSTSDLSDGPFTVT